MRRELSHRDSDRADDELRRIGCYSSMSTRTDEPGDPAASPEQYRDGYRAATRDSEAIYRDADTDDPETAARWYAEAVWSGGTAARGAYNGCLDALMGRPNRFADS